MFAAADKEVHHRYYRYHQHVGEVESLENKFFSYKKMELGGYFLGGWAAYFAKTGDNDSVNGHIAGIEAIIECYNRYSKSLKKDKKKILAFKKMQEEGTLRQYVIKHIGK